ncbi:MAG: sigma 54-interacting transcriptional regulator [Candidatus Eisenbacteria bacterium]
MLGSDKVMLDVLETARKVAQSGGTSVLLLGETGTGKSLLAQTIHAASPRRHGPFVDINCGSIPLNLLESELFGHVKGAFTDAKEDKPGLLELADGGTAFLDEVGELSLALQVKLLKFLDSGELRRVAGSQSIKVDVRVLAATNRDLEAEVQAGRFRLDLYHRLNVVTLKLPALRERPRDIEHLARHHLDLQARRLRGQSLDLAPEALEALLRYSWPGNVRELMHAMERTALLIEGQGPVRPQDLPPEITPRAAVCEREEHTQAPLVRLPDGGISLVEVERAFLAAALERTRGNVTEAARLLHMSRGSFRYQMEKLGLKGKAGGRRGRPRKRRIAA